MKFGTSGLRGLAVDLTGSASSLYAEAFIIHLTRLGMIEAGSRVFIGRDYRTSSPTIRDLCAAGIAAQAMVAIDCGALPTPALANYAMGQGAPSLMITGSHIPEDMNGIKFYRPDGEIGKGDEAAIKSIADDMWTGNASMLHSTGEIETDEGAATSGFLERCRNILPKNSLAGMRVGIYEHSSVGRDMLHDVLRKLGAETIALGRSETFVAVDTEAVSSETRLRLAAWCVEHDLDAIVSTDGDADRPLVADEAGIPLRGDLLGLITAEFVGASFIATPVTSNSGIVSSKDVEVMRTKVGSPYVIEAMKSSDSHGVVVGFEANGGFLLQTDANVPGGRLTALPTRDCFLPIIAALYRLVEKSMPLSGLVTNRDFPVAVSDRLSDIPTELSMAFVEGLTNDKGKAAQYFGPVGKVDALNGTDGARFTLNLSEVVHYRISGNAPELRCYCEAATEERANELLEFGLSRAAQRFSQD